MANQEKQESKINAKEIIDLLVSNIVDNIDKFNDVRIFGDFQIVNVKKDLEAEENRLKEKLERVKTKNNELKELLNKTDKKIDEYEKRIMELKTLIFEFIKK